MRVTIKSYHADNHPFTANNFVNDLEFQIKQYLKRSRRPSSKWVAERSLQTVFSWTRTMMRTN
jgi:hypothetical protein